MYDFHYEKIVQWYNNIHLCFTDIDSLLYEIETNDIYSNMLKNKEDYDFSEYSLDHNNYDITNKVIGKFKDI